MTDQSYLVTTYCFKGKDFLVKMNIFNRNTLDVKVTDKVTSETWHCSYDSTYIENLTHKTGNFKQFDIFATMLKSGLLKTSESISLDLLTFDDLEALRSRRVMCPPHAAHVLPATASNRRYLILTYTVEFDRIHYPLPMEYCGLPDPQVLQSTIRRMEQEISQLHEKLKNAETQGCDDYLLEQVKVLEGRVAELTSENEQLREEVLRLNNQLIKKQPSRKHTEALRSSLSALEEQFKKDKTYLCHQVHHLREEKARLLGQLLYVVCSQLEEYKATEKSLRSQLHRSIIKSSSHNCTTRQSRIDSFRKTSPCKTPEHRTAFTSVLKEKSPNRDNQKKNNNKNLTSLPLSKSDFPLTHNNRRSASNSSNEKQTKLRATHSSPHRCHSCSSHRSSSNESTRSITQHKPEMRSKMKATRFQSQRDHSSSDSSISPSADWKNQSHLKKNSARMSKSNKALKNDTRIQDLEDRINSLQQMLESDLPFTARNVH